jgi:outer membrane autotransporter protein
VTPVPAPSAIDTPLQGTVPPRDDRQLLDCPDPRRLDPSQPVRPECENVKPMCWPDNCQAGTEGLQQVPITPGRDLGVGLQADWNLWTDFTAISVSDGRYGLDVTGWSRLGTVGLDRRITSNLVLGLSFSLEDNMTGGYGGFFSAATRGLTFSPYAALLLSDNWAIEAALGYSRLSNNISIAVLSGSYFSQRLSGSLRLHGQYDLDFFAVRPRLSSSYVKTFSDSYDMQGAILGQALAVTYPGADYDYATLGLAVEFNKLFTMANGNRLMPFAEVGTVYEAVRPNGGQILSSDLQFVTPSPWSFQARAGVRMLISDAVLLEARAGYLSFGQSGLDVVEGRLHLSFSF